MTRHDEAMEAARRIKTAPGGFESPDARQLAAYILALTPPASGGRDAVLEEAAKELSHRAFLCHTHDDFGKGRERGLLDGVKYVRALTKQDAAVTGEDGSGSEQRERVANPLQQMRKER